MIKAIPWSALQVFAIACSVAGAAPPDIREFDPALTSFEPVGEAVFSAGSAGAWDEKIRERGWIIRDGEHWQLWYTGYRAAPAGARRMLGYATSTDGRRWTRHPDNPIHRDHWVEDMMVVRHDGAYVMFAEGERDIAHWFTSPDGIRWTRMGNIDIRKTNGEPIAPGPYGTPTVIRQRGVWNLFYERRDAAVWLARSTDLRAWTNVQDEPVLQPGPDDYDRRMIAVNQIVERGGKYYAYYHGLAAGEPRAWTTNVAVSDDLIRWRKFPANPLVRNNESSGIVIPDRDRFLLYTMHDVVRVRMPKREH
jgi:hypothetical protein